MKTILLLAGRSRRFWPLAEKSFFPICGKTLAQHQVERLREAGCDDILLVVGAHNRAEASACFPDMPLLEQTDLDKGMQGALLDVLPQCGNESVLIISGNDVVEVGAYRALRQRMDDATIHGLLLAKKVDRYFPGGYLTLDGKHIRDVIEKPEPGTEPSDLVNIVAHAHRDASLLLTALRDVRATRDDGYELALRSLCQAHVYEAVTYDGLWQPVKYPWHMLTLLPHFLGTMQPHIAKSAQIHPSAVVEGNVMIAEDVKILPHASIMGPCFIGKGTVIGNCALVRGSSIGAHCVVGYGTEVKGSVLADHVWMHMAYAGDSVVGNNVSFGACAVTGNLRLDEGEIFSAHAEEKIPTGLTKFGAIIGDDCRLGVHAVLQPGIKIGARSFVSSGVIVERDIPDGSFVTMKDGVSHVRENRAEIPHARERVVYKKNAGL